MKIKIPVELLAVALTLVIGSGPALTQAPPLFAPPTAGPSPDPPPLATGSPHSTDVPHPTEFLGYPLGEHFTEHAQILAYLETLAAASERVAFESYGTTYEGRPLTLLAISSPRNLARLEEIREANLRLAAGDGSRPASDQKIIVWLAYGVHGNESSAAEAAIATAYTLAAAEGEWERLLDEVVVLLDPLVNPDGRERYVGFYKSHRGHRADPDPAAVEHLEPWPGGRQNHYLIDLNRDWAWASQAETRARLAAYRRWEPQVYVDFHEMSAESTYFFPPSAEPVHPEIAPEIVGWLEVFGRANAAAFDRQGWTYYVGEVFDLFYPGYGDSYPSLRGAVGMTYEMAGGGRAGSLVELPDGRRLNLADRVGRHFTTSLATVETAARNRREILRDFARSRQPESSVVTYLWPPDQGEARALAELLDDHGVDVRALSRPMRLRVEPLVGEGEVERELPAGTWAVTTGQPLGRLVRALMESENEMPSAFLDQQRRRLEANRETEFYDVTAWSLPLAYNLEAWRLEGEAAGLETPAPPETAIGGVGGVGVLVPPQGLVGYRFAAELLRRGIRPRLTLDDFRIGGADYPAGTLFIPRLGQPEGLDAQLGEAIASAGIRGAQSVASSYTETGPSLGSDGVAVVKVPEVGILSGDGVGVTSFGSLWHLLDQLVGLDHTRLDTAHLGRIDLTDFDVLVLPDGRYGEALDGEAGDEIARWVRRGGTLVAIAGAADWLEQKELTQVERWHEPSENESDAGHGGEGDDYGGEIVEGGSNGLERRPLHTPGAILATQVSPSHPLTAGVETPPPVLFLGSDVFLPTGNPKIDVLMVRADDPVLGGFVWPEKRDRLRGALLVSAEEIGEGRVVIFAEDPAFRLFWRATMPIFLNAVIYGPSLGEL